MRPATSELTRTSWFGSAAIEPLTVIVRRTSAFATRVTVTFATASAEDFTSSSVSAEDLCEQAGTASAARSGRPKAMRENLCVEMAISGEALLQFPPTRQRPRARQIDCRDTRVRVAAHFAV